MSASATPTVTDQFSFTKVVVDDLERSAAFYQRVFGLSELARVDADIAGRPISEIMFSPTGEEAATFVLLTFTGAGAPPTGGVIAGFVTADLAALVERATTAGGSVVAAIREMPEHGVKVAFLHDVEGHLLEVVELLG